MIENVIKQGVILTEFNFSEALGRPLKEEVTVGVTAGTMTVTKANNILLCCVPRITDQTIDFRFLPYACGAINYCESRGVDVLSGYFSGCIMARYQRDGDWRVCHVHTGGPDDCKERWNAIKMESLVEEVREFKPSDHAPSPKTLGLITATGGFYAIGCDPEINGQGQMSLRVTKVKSIK